MTRGPPKKSTRRHTQTQTHSRQPREDRCGDGTDVARSHRTPGAPRKGKSQKEDPALGLPEGTWPCPHADFRLWPPGLGEKDISVVLSVQAFATSLESHAVVTAKGPSLAEPQFPQQGSGSPLRAVRGARELIPPQMC